ADAAAREVIDAFYAAAAGATSRGCSPCSPRRRSFGCTVPTGPSSCAARATMGARPDALGHPALIDGAPGVLITVGGRPVMIMAFTVADGAITAIRTLTHPDWLAQVVPSWVA